MTAVEKTHCARFDGLHKDKIRRVLEIDEEAQHVTTHDEALKIRASFTSAGLSLTSDRMHEYGKIAEKAGRFNVARQWYEEVMSASGNDKPLRILLVKVGWRKEAEKHFGHLTADEYRAIGNRKLDGYLNKEAVLEAYCAFNAADDTDGLNRVWVQAVKLGEHDIATRAAVRLGRVLTTREHEAIGRGLMEQHHGVTTEIIRYVNTHRIERLKIECMKRLVRDGVSLKKLRHAARSLGVQVSTGDLEALFRVQRTRETDPDAAVITARSLGRINKRWRARLPAIYAWARDTHLGWGHVKRANTYGRLCGQSITFEEAMAVYTRRSNDSDQHLEWVRTERAEALALATRRITESLAKKS